VLFAIFRSPTSVTDRLELRRQHRFRW
jgi:hypothetical protein